MLLTFEMHSNQIKPSAFLADLLALLAELLILAAYRLLNKSSKHFPLYLIYQPAKLKWLHTNCGDWSSEIVQSPIEVT